MISERDIFNSLRRAWFIMLFLFSLFFSFAQDVGEVEYQKVTTKEWEVEFLLNTSGFGIGFQHGRTPDYYNKHFWEVTFLYNQHSKAVRGRNPIFSDATIYSYGKLNDLFFLRGGYGYQRILNHKPYWGGVQVRYAIAGGFSLGMAMPVILRVRVQEGGEYKIVSERYDPENSNHTVNNIIGRAGFFKGIGKTALRPGFYVRTGLHFDFSQKQQNTHALEVGVSIDMVFPYIQQMAFNKAKPFYFGAYIAYHVGKKKGLYE